MVQNKERYPMKTTATFMTCIHFVIVCMIVVNAKFQYCNKHIIKNVSILKYVIGADGKIIKSSIGKNIFFLIALISERKEKNNF